MALWSRAAKRLSCLPSLNCVQLLLSSASLATLCPSPSPLGWQEWQRATDGCFPLYRGCPRQPDPHSGPPTWLTSLLLLADSFWLCNSLEADSDLPAGWMRVQDTSGTYYWHIPTGTTQWEPPLCGGRGDSAGNTPTRETQVKGWGAWPWGWAADGLSQLAAEDLLIYLVFIFLLPLLYVLRNSMQQTQLILPPPLISPQQQ